MATAAAASQFTGVDFQNLDTLLSEEERAVRDTVRTWVDENLIPVIGTAYIEGKFPKQLIPGMAELGLFGANLPEEYGCAGLNNVAYGLIMQELERGDSGIRSFPLLDATGTSTGHAELSQIHRLSGGQTPQVRNGATAHCRRRGACTGEPADGLFLPPQEAGTQDAPHNGSAPMETVPAAAPQPEVGA
jgi:alkylation response protein AidB-like acyl-CoA dehydrogenase